MRMTEEQYQELLQRRAKLQARLEPRADLMNPLSKSLAAKRPKYGNRKVTDADGLTHDSRKEYDRWCVLKLRAAAGEISDLHRQVVFDICVNGLLVCRYIADAQYVENATGERITEDTKSEPTRKKRDFVLKRKLMKAVHNIEVKLV